ncbi:MAG: SDR family oxidoreductase [Gemmatimonadota bacterium]|nr:SDR family oxidoreductase [Gemmatimonadota bacterium]
MSNKVVVITGASGGIGAALAEQLAQQGHHVALLARREPELRAVALRCGENALPILVDVTHREAVNDALDQAVEHFGHVDVWVNNAGRGITRSAIELTDHDIDEMMLINVKSALYGMQAAFAHFRERGEGHIINVSSMLGRIPLAPYRSAYGASKHFLNALTANFRDDVRAAFPGIQVSLVSPGVVATDFGLNSVHGGSDNRLLPNAQSAEAVAEVIAGVIQSRKADVYTFPGAQQAVVNYYSADR